MSLQMEAKLAFPTAGRVAPSPDNYGHVHRQELFALLSVTYNLPRCKIAQRQ